MEALDDYAPEPEVHKYLHSRWVRRAMQSMTPRRSAEASRLGIAGAAERSRYKSLGPDAHAHHRPMVMNTNYLKYLHTPRLVGFDVETLYELHYQMITLVRASEGGHPGKQTTWPPLAGSPIPCTASVQGKVFCNKLRPNCSACPLRDACEFALNGGPEKKVRRATAQAAGFALAPPTPDKHREPPARPQPAIRRASLAMPGELEASPPRPRPVHKLHWRQVQRLQRMQAEQDPERGAGLDAVLGSVQRGKRSRRGGAGGEPGEVVDLTPLGGLAEDLSMDAESLQPMILHSVPQGTKGEAATSTPFEHRHWMAWHTPPCSWLQGREGVPIFFCFRRRTTGGSPRETGRLGR